MRSEDNAVASMLASSSPEKVTLPRCRRAASSFITCMGVSDDDGLGLDPGSPGLPANRHLGLSLSS